jgi:hypothetical protein
MPWNLVLLPLLGGFIFLDWCYYCRLRNQRIEGNRLLLESAFAGVFVSFLGGGLTWLFDPHPKLIQFLAQYEPTIKIFTVVLGLLLGRYYFSHFGYPVLRPAIRIIKGKLTEVFRRGRASEAFGHICQAVGKTIVAIGVLPLMVWGAVSLVRNRALIDYVSIHWSNLAPFDHSGMAALTLIAGLGLALLFNFFTDYYGAAVWAAEQAGDYLVSLSMRAIRERKFLTILLSNKVALMGYVKLSPNLKSDGHIAIIVAAQGVIESSSLEILWAANYLPIWKNDHQRAEQFLLVIPMRLIENAHISADVLDEPVKVRLAKGLPATA